MKKLFVLALFSTYMIASQDTTTKKYRYSGQAAVEHLTETGECERCDLSRQDLRVAIAAVNKFKKTPINLKGAKLSGAILSNADLSGAILSNACLLYAKLEGAILSNAYLSDTIAVCADLSYAKLEGAKLEGANTLYANFYGANMTNVIGYIQSSDYDLVNATLTTDAINARGYIQK